MIDNCATFTHGDSDDEGDIWDDVHNVNFT